ncbi:hypothetical protein N9T73_00285 [bacterium]|nr:hypothetical protein [bacterium]
MNININSISELLQICKNVGCSVKYDNNLRSIKKELITFLKTRQQKGGAYGLCEVPHAVVVTPDYPRTYRITDQMNGRLSKLAPGTYNLVKSDFVMGDSMGMKERIQKIQGLYLLHMISLFHYDIFHVTNSKPEITELIMNCKYAHITVNEILEKAIYPANPDELAGFTNFKVKNGSQLIGPDYNFNRLAMAPYHVAIQISTRFDNEIFIERPVGTSRLNIAGNLCYDHNPTIVHANIASDAIGYDGLSANHSNLATAIIKKAEEKIKKLLTAEPGLRVFYISILHELGSRNNDGSIIVPINELAGNHTDMYDALATTPLVDKEYDNLSKFCNFLSGDPN